jgi:hypothetical protein
MSLRESILVGECMADRATARCLVRRQEATFLQASTYGSGGGHGVGEVGEGFPPWSRGQPRGRGSASSAPVRGIPPVLSSSSNMCGKDRNGTSGSVTARRLTQPQLPCYWAFLQCCLWHRNSGMTSFHTAQCAFTRTPAREKEPSTPLVEVSRVTVRATSVSVSANARTN